MPPRQGCSRYLPFLPALAPGLAAVRRIPDATSGSVGKAGRESVRRTATTPPLTPTHCQASYPATPAARPIDPARLYIRTGPRMGGAFRWSFGTFPASSGSTRRFTLSAGQPDTDARRGVRPDPPPRSLPWFRTLPRPCGRPATSRGVLPPGRTWLSSPRVPLRVPSTSPTACLLISRTPSEARLDLHDRTSFQRSLAALRDRCWAALMAPLTTAGMVRPSLAARFACRVLRWSSSTPEGGGVQEHFAIFSGLPEAAAAIPV